MFKREPSCKKVSTSGAHKRKLTYATEEHHSDEDMDFNVTEISAVNDS